MNKTVELLPCPFCGNDELTAEPETTYVMCHGCDADGPMTKPGGAIAAWNTRAAPAEDVRAVVEEPVYLFIDEQGMPGWTVRWDVAKHLPYPVETVYRRLQRQKPNPDAKKPKVIMLGGNN